MSMQSNSSGSEPETDLRAFMRYEPVADRLILLQHRDKRPINRGWPTERNSFADAVQHMKHGFNVGMRLGSGICVVDWDERNDPTHADPGGNSLTRLARDTGLILRDDAIVETGNGL